MENYSNLISTCLREFSYLGIHDFRKEAILYSSTNNIWTSHDYLEIYFISFGISLIYFYSKMTINEHADQIGNDVRILSNAQWDRNHIRLFLFSILLIYNLMSDTQ